MTDISESGIEAALDASYAGKTVLRLLVDGWDAHVPVEDRWRITEDIVKTAIQAYLPFHPPASREEGLREAATNVLDFAKIYEEQPQGDTNKAVVRALRLVSADILELIPTKPEATEPHWAARNEPDYADPARPPGAYATESKKPE